MIRCGSRIYGKSCWLSMGMVVRTRSLDQAIPFSATTNSAVDISMGLRSSLRPVMNIHLLGAIRNPSAVEKLSKIVENTWRPRPKPRLRGRFVQKISSSILTRGRGFAASARIRTRMLAIVRRFQKATAVAPKRADPAIKKAVDHRPRLGVGSIAGIAAIGA